VPSLPIGGFAAFVVIAVLKAPPAQYDRNLSAFQRLRELDLIGASLLIPAVVCLLLALQWGGNKYPWSNSRIIGLFIGFGLFTIVFVISQAILGDRATLPPRILGQRSVAAAIGFAMFFGGAIFLLMYYLPLYFQSVRGDSATRSGIDILPLMGGTVFSSVLVGGMVTAVGYYTPFLIGSQILICIGLGLVTTYTVNIATSKWIGYQILAGLGAGAGFQIPMTAVQTVLSKDDISLGSAAVVFFQNLGGALFISVAQSVFQNGLIRGLAQYAPTVSPQAILGAGATEFRNVLASIGQEDQVENVILAYMTGLRDSYRVSLSVACVAAVAACFLEWKSVKHGEGQGREPAGVA
jgi:hypothetical protein